MRLERVSKAEFSVIGREGSTDDGAGFIQRLWEEANAHYGEVSALAKTDESGAPAGFWGAMTDFSRAFRPWEDGFARGLYLAGVECRDDAVPPAGWTKWTLPAFEYIAVSCGEGDAFGQGMEYLAAHGLSLAGAVQDFISPGTGDSWMLFPIARPGENEA